MIICVSPSDIKMTNLTQMMTALKRQDLPNSHAPILRDKYLQWAMLALKNNGTQDAMLLAYKGFVLSQRFVPCSP
jgi:hypothetical protein